jgi:putative transposase
VNPTKKTSTQPTRLRWAQLRLMVIGPLLAAPPETGKLQERFIELAETSWKHPTTGKPKKFGVSTIERWYYAARGNEQDPVLALERKTHALAGQNPSVNEPIRAALRIQHREHPAWSYQLHYDNLCALAEKEAELGMPPSYGSVRRWMKKNGLLRNRRKKGRGKNGQDCEFTARERRSFEVQYAHALWHLDFHRGSRKVILPDGSWHQAQLLGILDDRTRLCCHLQWYLAEDTQALVHGLLQALLKRGLPRMLLTDNGSAMLAEEVQDGLARLGIVHVQTLPYTPEQNAKQEVFWVQIEGRLMPMLEGVEQLTLKILNDSTLAWVEGEYNHRLHRELGSSPIHCMMSIKGVARLAPESDVIRRAFRRTITRVQRQSDGTVSISGRRFEVPARFRTLEKLTIRYAEWDLTAVDLVDSHTHALLCVLLPLDKQRNATSGRRALEAITDAPAGTEPSERQHNSGIAPLLQKHIDQQNAQGTPPPYLPLTHANKSEESPAGIKDEDLF